MEQNTCPMFHDYSLMYRWKYCRLVGIINKVYFVLSSFVLVIFGLMFALATNCLVCEHSHNDACRLCLVFIMYEAALWPSVIFSFIFLIGCLKMIYVNNGLRSTNIPTGGEKVKTWLRYHIVFLVLSVMSFGGLLFKDFSANGLDLFYSGITSIILMIEINVVDKFNKEFEISADIRNRSFQISNI